MASGFRSRHPDYLIYLYTTATIGFAMIAYSSYEVLTKGVDSRWIVLTVLAAIVASFTLKIPGMNSKISIGDTFVLINLILFGPSAGCISAALEAFAGSVRSSTKARRLEFTLFNTGNVAMCAYLSGLAYLHVPGHGPLYHNPATTLAGLFPSAVVLALCYYLLNSGTVTIMVSLELRKGVYQIWKEDFLWCSINYLACSFAAVLISFNGELLTGSLLTAAALVVITIYTACRAVLSRAAGPATLMDKTVL